MTVIRKIIAGFLWSMAVFGLLYAGDFWTPLLLAGIGSAVWPRRSGRQKHPELPASES